MHFDIKTVVVVATNLLVFFLTVMVNNSLAAYSIHLSIASLYLIPAILHLQLRWGFLTVVIQGLLIDSNFSHDSYGFHLWLFLTLFTVLTYFKSTIRRSTYYQIVVLCIGINTFVILIQGIRWGDFGLLGEWAYWLRLLIDMSSSGLVLLAITGWFIALQRQLIFFTGVDLDPEEDM